MFSGSGGGWWFLLMAGLSEICYAAVIPKTDGFTRLWPTLYCAFFIAQPVAAGHRHTHAAHWHRLRRVGRHGRATFATFDARFGLDRSSRFKPIQPYDIEDLG